MIDSHCHFDFPDFDADREEVWARCKDSGLAALLIPGTHKRQWDKARTLCERYPNWYFSSGLHPWWLFPEQDKQTEHTKRFIEDSVSHIVPYLRHEQCIAVGECGLDKNRLGHKTLSPNDVFALQKSAVEMQIELANREGLPVIFHAVKAHAELIALLKRIRPMHGGVVHGFTGSLEVAQAYVSLGLKLGIGGSITYERAKKTRHAVANIGLEHILLETDAPSMPISGRQGERNSPEYIMDITQCLSGLTEAGMDEINIVTTRNFYTVFGLS